MIAIDTNVFVYSIDVTDPAKLEIAKSQVLASAEAGNAVLVWQVSTELLRWLRRGVDRGQLLDQHANSVYREIRNTFELVLLSERQLDLALDLYSRYCLSHWDSLLLAACVDASIETLYTEDLTHGAEYAGIKVINPFLVNP